MTQATISYLTTIGGIACFIIPAYQGLFKKDKHGFLGVSKLGWMLFGLALYLWFVTIADNCVRRKEKALADKERADDREMYQGEINSLKLIIDSLSVDPAERDSVGLGLSGILTINDIPDRRRKFLFDIGQSTEHDRMSLYLDFDNNLIFRIIDSRGETYSLRVVENFITFKRGAKYFIYCDVGTSKNYSFLRLYLDDRRIGIQEFDSKIDIVPISSMKNFTIGADIEGHNVGKFTISSYSLYNSPLKKSQIKYAMNDLIVLFENLHADK